jgi:hypothetical protein
MDLIKQSGLFKETQDLKEYLKENYYGKEGFDKNGFFFITHRSDTAGCAYLDYDTVRHFIVNKKHCEKGVDKTLVKLCAKRLKERFSDAEYINIDKVTSNVDFDKLIFK